MATGRSLLKYGRIYLNGYDLSGYARSVTPFSVLFAEGTDDPLSADITGTWLGQATISPGTMSAIFDNTATTGIHALLSAPDAKRNLIYAQGIQAAPAAGDPCFCGEYRQNSYNVAPQETPMSLTIAFSPSAGASTSINYSHPWGVLLHANGAETAASTDSGIDQLAGSTDGGFMVYQVLDAAGTGDITATLKVQDSTSTSDADFGDLLSSGAINCGSGGVAVPTYGVVALALGSTVKQYVRWQIALGTATSVTFVLAFCRNYT